MSYRITAHTKAAAKRHGLTVRPSKRAGKKIDVIKNGNVVASVGATGYTDYGTLLQKGNRAEANKRRKAYKQRHQKHRTRKGTASWYADKLLW